MYAMNERNFFKEILNNMLHNQHHVLQHLQILRPLETISLYLQLSFKRSERLERFCISLNEMLVDTGWFCWNAVFFFFSRNFPLIVKQMEESKLDEINARVDMTHTDSCSKNVR